MKSHCWQVLHRVFLGVRALIKLSINCDGFSSPQVNIFILAFSRNLHFITLGESVVLPILFVYSLLTSVLGAIAVRNVHLRHFTDISTKCYTR